MPEKEKALVIVYYWPPSGGSGVQRWTYFTRYLEEFGIVPTVVTVDPNYASYPSFDKSLEEKVRHVRVYRTKTMEPLRFYSFLKGGNKQSNIPQGSVGGVKKGVFDKLSLYIRGNFFIPDARVGWNRYAYAKAEELLKTEHFDCIITTGPPHSTHLVGLKLKQRFPVKWLADFRDPWTDIFYNDLFNRTERNKRKDLALELAVLEQADLVLTVGPALRELLIRKIPASPDKVHYIFNGFDAEKLEGLQRSPNKRFTISYIGIIGSNYPYRAFIESLKNCLKQHPEWELTIRLTGRIEQEVIAAFKELTSVELIISGNVSHREALQTMVNADLLLLILPMNELSKIIVSGKLMEYIACGVPILGIINPESDAAHVIRDYAQGQAFHPDNITGIETFLKAAKNGTLEHRETIGTIDSFKRKSTAEQLAGLIKGL